MFTCQEVDTNARPRTAGLACIVCGCTDDRACPGGCYWSKLDPPVCSACVAIAADLYDDDNDVDDHPRGGFFGHQRCGASRVPATHALVWIDEHTGYCARCREGFMA